MVRSLFGFPQNVSQVNDTLGRPETGFTIASQYANFMSSMRWEITYYCSWAESNVISYIRQNFKTRF